MNHLYFGDNLEILKENIADESIDLIYIDPPFNSKRNYNILFESVDLSDVKAQKQAFADTWSNVSYKDELNEILDLNKDLYDLLKALDKINISTSAVSYLTTMALRIYYMHKKLKDTGSFYLHCDPTMSHYLKLVCDLIFGVKNFRNEIIWHYRRWTNVQNQFQKMHDVIFFYSKTDTHYFDPLEVDMSASQMKKFKRGYDTNVINNPDGSKLRQLIVYDKDKVEKLEIDTSKYDKIIYREKPKVASPDVWLMPVLNSQSKERIGYPTQKPEALLERIIKASSKEGDVVADFFCGCGTAVAVAERLNRKWIGVDISHLAVRLILNRILKPYEDDKDKYKEIRNNIQINGLPKDIASAKELARHTKKGRLKFQDWVVEFLLNGVSNPKKTADSGYDGYLTFYKTPKDKEIVLIEVKSGKVGVKNIREFINVVNKQDANLGIFVCFEDEITKPMLLRAKEEGYYEPEIFGSTYDKIQIITIEDLLAGKMLNLPRSNKTTFKNAVKNEDIIVNQTKIL